MDTSNWTDLLVKAFPNLRYEGCNVVEPPSERYNCIAYAGGDTSRWWDHNQRNYWPAYATRSNSIDSLIEVFIGIRFEICDDSRAEP